MFTLIEVHLDYDCVDSVKAIYSGSEQECKDLKAEFEKAATDSSYAYVEYNRNFHTGQDYNPPKLIRHGDLFVVKLPGTE